MDTPAASPETPPRSRGWVLYFVVLVALAVTAIVLPIVYNLRQQLRPEQLDEARQRWREHGPADYDLTFAVHHDNERWPERNVVLVRQGRVVFAAREGEVVQMAPPLAALVGLPAGATGPERGLDVPAMFQRLETLLNEQGEAGGRNFLVAVFDPHTGYPRRFIRRVRGSKTREEWNVRVWGPGEVERQVKRP